METLGTVAIEDLKIGDFVTVLKGKCYDRTEGSMFSEGGIKVIGKTEDGSYKGEVLEVLAVDYPYVALKNHSMVGIIDSPIHLDLREWGLKRLSDAYVKAILKK